MRVGVVLPQGWAEQFPAITASAAWGRTVSAARTADHLGFDSGWFYDHFHVWPKPTRDAVFESFTALTGVAGATRRIRLGHLVLCAGYRNPALVAKMISSLDVISDGRVDLGIGAGWYEEEWRAYGYAFPERSVRLETLRDHLEVISRMLGPGDASYAGAHAAVDGAVNEPKPVQAHVPIMVGGNGPNVTWRLAARYADELNLDGMSPSRTSEALAVIASRCEEIERDPATLRVSVHVFRDQGGAPGQERVDLLGAYRSLEVTRVMTLPPGLVESDDVLHSLAEDCVTAGVAMDPLP